MNIQSLKVSLLIMGVSGIVTQIILLREFLVSFLGNELTVGIILANWLILEAIGSFIIGKSVEKVERKIEAFVFFQLFFSMTLQEYPFHHSWRRAWLCPHLLLLFPNSFARHTSPWSPFYLRM
jgi:hypothetical protein